MEERNQHPERRGNAEGRPRNSKNVSDIFLGHFADVGSQLAKTTAVYNNAAGSAESRLTPHLRKLRELGGQPEETPEDKLPKPVEMAPRRLFGDHVDVATGRELL